jgi:glycosyltransferase involved in cell wall biosynthesis
VLSGLFRARRFVRDFKPAVVHSHSFPANLFARLLRLFRPRLVVLSTVHNVCEGGWHRMLAYRITDRLSSHTVAVSGAAAERFARLRAVPRLRLSIVPNGIDVTEFIPDQERRARMRAQMGLDEVSASAGFIWLTIGRVAPAKDYPNLLCAFEAVSAEAPKSQLWIAGEPSRGGSAESRPAVGVATTKEAASRVRWLGLRNDVPALLDAADGFVLASAWEGMPLVVGEAMAMGKLIVATDVGGVRELAGDMGTLVEAKNPTALAESMVATMRQSRESLAAQGRAARERIVQHFSMETRADAWEALYRKLIA